MYALMLPEKHLFPAHRKQYYFSVVEVHSTDKSTSLALNLMYETEYKLRHVGMSQQVWNT